MRRLFVVAFALAASSDVAHANFGYCYTPGLMGGMKVIVHDQVREGDFWDGATVNAYRRTLEESRRFRFGTLTCPGYDTEAEAIESLSKIRQTFLENAIRIFRSRHRSD